MAARAFRHQHHHQRISSRRKSYKNFRAAEGGASCLLPPPTPLRDVSTVRVNHFSYPTRTRSGQCLPVTVWTVPDPRRRFLPQITLGRVTPTSQRHRPIITLPRRPNGNRTPRVQCSLYPRVGTATPVVCGTIRYANWGLNARIGEMLIKTSWVRSFPFLLLLAFLPPPFPSTFISTSSPGHS